MKKMLVIALCLLVASPCFASVKLFKFVNDGKVVGVSYSDKDGNVVAPEGTVAIEITEAQKTEAISQQIADAPAPFSYSALLESLWGKYTEEKIVKLAPYIGALEKFSEAGNWAGIKAFTDKLIKAGIMEKDDYLILWSTFNEQGIDLEKYGAS